MGKHFKSLLVLKTGNNYHHSQPSHLNMKAVVSGLKVWKNSPTDQIQCFIQRLSPCYVKTSEHKTVTLIETNSILKYYFMRLQPYNWKAFTTGPSEDT